MPIPTTLRKQPLGCLKPRLKLNGVTHGWASPERGTRQQRGYGAVWDRLRIFILKRDRYLCRPCLRMCRITNATSVDHVVPRAEGGSDDPSNLEAICTACHSLKTHAEANRVRTGGA